MYYRAVGTNVPVPFSKRVLGKTLPESVSKPQNDSTGAKSIDKGDCQNTPFVKTPSGSTATGADITETGQKGFDNQGVLTDGLGNENPSNGTDEVFDTDLGIYKEMRQSYWD